MKRQQHLFKKMAYMPKPLYLPRHPALIKTSTSTHSTALTPIPATTSNTFADLHIWQSKDLQVHGPSFCCTFRNIQKNHLVCSTLYK